MSVIGVCLPDQALQQLAPQLAAAGAQMRAVAPHALADADTLRMIDVLVVPADPRFLVPQLIAACDQHAVRIVPWAADDAAVGLAQARGLVPMRELSGDALLAAAASMPAPAPARPDARVIAVWGTPGAPGRTMLAVALAAQLAKDRRVTLVDADSHAPSAAMHLGLAVDVPGLAGACRAVSRGVFDEAEFVRISAPAPRAATGLRTLVGINRPERWPELRADRVSAVLQALRAWNDTVVIDCASSIEADEALLDDLGDAPARNAATIASLGCADRVLVLAGADPVGLARLVRALDQLRETSTATAVTVVINRLRSGAIGVNPRGQIRQLLEAYGVREEVLFVPDDAAAADRALLHTLPVGEAMPKSHLAAAVRRIAESVAAPAPLALS